MKALARQLTEAARVLRSFKRITNPAIDKHWVNILVDKGQVIYLRKEKP